MNTVSRQITKLKEKCFDCILRDKDFVCFENGEQLNYISGR